MVASVRRAKSRLPGLVTSPRDILSVIKATKVRILEHFEAPEEAPVAAMPSRSVLLVTILTLLIQYANGYQNVVYVSESITDDENLLTSGEAPYSTCCVYGNCSCNSLDSALANLTSNVLINITTDVTLSSLIEVSCIENVTIIGHNKPTVECIYAGGLHINFCHNCIVEGITWNRCGAKSINDRIEAGLKLSNSSYISIKNCLFQHSRGHAVLLSDVSGDVSISHCNFAHNNHYGGHGAAIYYLSNEYHYFLEFTISNSNFTDNKNAKSLLYTENRNFQHNITIHNSKFCQNQGVSVYAVNQNIYLSGKILFQNNTAANGTGMYITDYSTVLFDENANVKFIQNSADINGGAVVTRNNSKFIVNKSSVVEFNANEATSSGAVYSELSSNIVFKATCKVTFWDNLARPSYEGNGGAIFVYNNSNVVFEGNATVLFSNNNAKWFGGAICCYSNCTVRFDGNASPIFSTNVADLYASPIFSTNGALYSNDDSYIYFKGNSSPVFSSNIAEYYGGVIYSHGTYFYFEGSSSPVFINNTADIGGAIMTHLGYISFEGNSNPMFVNNTAHSVGGAINLHQNDIFFKGNSSVLFSNNSAEVGGGALIISCCNIHFEENSSIMFRDNMAAYYSGGAICFAFYCNIVFEGNTFAVFSGNTADNGGAIYFTDDSSISFKANSTVKFINNFAVDSGGAVHSNANSDITFEGFSTVVFENNTAARGGAIAAIMSSDILFSDDSTIAFTNNSATLNTAVVFCNGGSITTNGNSNVMFNNLSVKWCTNTCLPYTGEVGVVAISEDSNVWCNDLGAFICTTYKCYCRNLEELLDGVKSNTVVNITENVILSTIIKLFYLDNISIIGYTNIIVFCEQNGGLRCYSCSNLTIEGITWNECGSDHRSVIAIETSSGVTIQKCTFQYSMAGSILLNEINEDVNINHCNFTNNNYIGYGAAIFNVQRYQFMPTININNCNFDHNNGGEVLYFYQPSTNNRNIFLNNSSFINNQGASIFMTGRYILRVSGEVLFENNMAEDGAGIYVSGDSTIIFDGISNFINNSVDGKGAAIFAIYADLIFEQSSLVTFIGNKATNGTIWARTRSNVIFRGTSQVRFNSNLATQYGAAIYSSDYSHVMSTENSKVSFSNNVVSSSDLQSGGIIFSKKNSYICFDENSFTLFNSNTADFGAAIFSLHYSIIAFKNQSKVMFNANVARSCGVVTSISFSIINFTGNAIVTFDSNPITSNPETSVGIICTFQRTNVTFSGQSVITYTNNTIGGGGAVVFSESNIIIEENSTLIFYNNIAQFSSGGALTCYDNTTIIIKGNSNVTFNSNSASQSGGAIHSYNMCKIIFKDNSTSTFIGNTAGSSGGAILGRQSSEMICEGNSTLTFSYNTADNGGALYFTNSTITFKGSLAASFYNNAARQSGGVAYLNTNCIITIKDTATIRFDNNLAEQNAGVVYFSSSNISFKGNSTTILTSNKATVYGGGIVAYDNSNITIEENSELLFINNEATQGGGGGYFSSYCNFIMKENTTVTFDNNRAFEGGAVFAEDNVNLLFKGSSLALLYNNLAKDDGGTIAVLNSSNITFNDHTSVMFINNTAQYGGAIFLDETAVMVNNSDDTCINFNKNLARILGSSVYQDVPELCNSSCLNRGITGVKISVISTPPNKLEFYDPAVCIDNDNNSDTQCNEYYIQSVMPGGGVPVCLLDYYNQSVDSIQFLVQGETRSDYFINGPNHVLISCDLFEGISVIGNHSLSNSLNYSVSVTLTAFYPDWKQMSINLIIELSPCHLGFWYYPNSMRCECYNANSIVFCSGSSSTIRRGYWFGIVTGKPTVTFCPISYCNFTCCETSNGYYHLSPVRDNQCRSHRSGTACSICTDGYTLSFDSTECVNINNCSSGQTVLVSLLTVIYWIVMVTLVFAMMYYKIGIGYLYSITYYYSIVDILLSQNLQASRGLYLTVNILSSFSNIRPQFLGEFCLTTGISGIDQQFIHYVHPTAIILILVMISISARSSRRISAIISRGIIHVICLLLLLSYTSIASTSLLLMRSLTFHGIDKVYTYVSPDIEYFHGRHLAYGIISLLCMAFIVIGLPLLLTLEPFLNRKFNFAKIKPILDQFQGCYKDKYRCFAGYYMICRLVIIAIIIANSSNEFFSNYLLIVIGGIVALIHVLIEPYNKEILNKFDAIMLHLILLISSLAWLDDFDSLLVITMAFILVILPLLIFIAMTLFLHKDDFKKFITAFKLKNKPAPKNSNVNSDDIPMQQFDLIVDDSMRKNATVCAM